MDKQNWQLIINVIEEHYQNDDQAEITPAYLKSRVSEHPLLPFESYNFSRFSLKTFRSRLKYRYSHSGRTGQLWLSDPMLELGCRCMGLL